MKLKIYVGIFILLHLVYSCQGQQRQNVSIEQDTITDKADSYTLLFVGDIMTHGPQIAAAKRANGAYSFGRLVSIRFIHN